MIYPGLVSITFRQLSPQKVVDLVQQAQLVGIEWGGDIHVPHGDAQRARDVRQMTEDAGLQVAAYGSYYRVSHNETGPFDAVLETAVSLGAPLIRVWAGKQGSKSADVDYWMRVVDDSQRIADLAAQENIVIVYEFHNKTLTDTNEAARDLLERVAHKNVKSYWQPPRYSETEYNLIGLDWIMPWLWGLHVFAWHPETGARQPLAAGAEDWHLYLSKAAECARDLYALIEFVVDDEPANFLRDAETLRQWLAAIHRPDEDDTPPTKVIR